MTVVAAAVESQILCNNEIVQVPERGHTDTVVRSLIVKVGTIGHDDKCQVYSLDIITLFLCFLSSQAEGTEMMKAYNWLLCPKGQSGLHHR